MSLNKAIKFKKEHRRPYRGAKAVDKTCRNHGSDPWTRGAVNYKKRKSDLRGRDLEDDWE